MINKEIIDCELAYSKCFCEFYEDEKFIRFHDDLLKDMYDHHYTYIKKEMSDIELKTCVEEEIVQRTLENKRFCKLLLDWELNDTCLSMLSHKPEITRYGYYAFDVEKLANMQENETCNITKVCNEKMLEDILKLDRAHDEAHLGLDFCTRRVYRRGKVYTANEGVNSYICYDKGNPVGNCDLFIDGGIAKIEDFAVLPTCQRKGYGTTILKALIKQAIVQNVNRIYLITDEEDTAKEMYLKCGFSKIGEKTELFFEKIK